MITLTAEIKVKGENPYPFKIGESRIGEGRFGGDIDHTEVVNKRSLLSCESEIKDRADVEKPSYGLISNSGRISFRDRNFRFLGYANLKILKGNETVKIFLENTISKTKEQVGEYVAKDWDYDNDNFSVSVSFDDNLTYLQEVDFSGRERFYDRSPSNLRSFLIGDLTERIKSKGFSFDESSLDKLNKTSEKFLSTTFFLERGNVWASYNKVAQLLGKHIFLNKKGEISTTEEFDWS